MLKMVCTSEKEVVQFTLCTTILMSIGKGETMEKYDVLKLENQICFPLYACSKEIVRKYKPFLDEIDLTYTQYITMMVMWEHKEMSVKDLGEYLYLDSGTLTPVLKKLEQKGYVTRARDVQDERVLNVARGHRYRGNSRQVAQGAWNI